MKNGLYSTKLWRFTTAAKSLNLGSFRYIFHIVVLSYSAMCLICDCWRWKHTSVQTVAGAYATSTTSVKRNSECTWHLSVLQTVFLWPSGILGRAWNSRFVWSCFFITSALFGLILDCSTQKSMIPWINWFHLISKALHLFFCWHATKRLQPRKSFFWHSFLPRSYHFLHNTKNVCEFGDWCKIPNRCISHK